MILYPEVQKRAQEELDSVVGKDRLPSFDDRDNLPYINALAKETLRWNPIAPLGQYLVSSTAKKVVTIGYKKGVPHVTTKEDIYEGYHLPTGSIVIPNIWYANYLKVVIYMVLLHYRQFTHDPATYSNPQEFKPERHLVNGSELPEFDPTDLAFGFGRR